MRSKLDKKEDLEILNWLTSIDFGPQNNDYIKRRQPGTGEWLLEHDKYQNWIGKREQTLFCPGIPGAGKTILASVVVDDLFKRYHNDHTVGIAYIYCNFRLHDAHTAKNLLTSLLRQLSQDQPVLPSPMKELFGHHQAKRTEPSSGEILKTLHSVAAMYSRVFIIVDALDECSERNGCRKELLSEIFKLQVALGVNIMATSRFILSVEEEFESSQSLEIRASNHDIERYLDGRMALWSRTLSADLQTEIKSVISQAADGM